MKFTIASNILKHALDGVVGAISNNPVLPILEDFLFQVSDNKLIITATDLEIYTSVSVDLESVQKVGTVAIPAKLLSDTVKMLPSQPITIEANNDNFINITSAFGKYELCGEDSEDFPKMPTKEECETVSIPANYLLDMVGKTLFATSNDELRPAMTGVLFDFKDDYTYFVATDAHKLVKYELALYTQLSQGVIVPKRALHLLKNIVGSDDIKISFNAANVFFEAGNKVLVSRLIDARYPDYNAVFPKECDKRLIGNRADILRSVKRLANYTNKTTNQIAVELTANTLTVRAQDNDFQNKAFEQIPVEYADAPLTIGFNAKFLIDTLNALSSDEVTIEFTEPSRPAVITETDGGSSKMLVMPVMLNR